MKIFFFLIFFFLLSGVSYAEPPIMLTQDFEQLISLFLGGLCGVAFVIASSLRWP